MARRCWGAGRSWSRSIVESTSLIECKMDFFIFLENDGCVALELLCFEVLVDG